VGTGATQFLKSSDWEDNVSEFLQRLGEAADVSRAYIFQNSIGQNGIRVTSQKFEWRAANIEPQIDNPLLQDAPFDSPPFLRLREEMRQGKVLYGNVSNWSPDEKMLLEQQKVQSIVLAPIFVGQEWWGFMGFDECRGERDWQPAEIDALQAATGILGTAIERTRVARVLISTIHIAEAAHSAGNLNELYKAIHAIIGELMPARNFYIALYDPGDDLLSFPYQVDEYDEPFPPVRPGRGLTEYVLRTGEPLLATPEIFNELTRRGEVEQLGAPSIDWLGVPLKIQDKTIGVLAVQSYTPGVRFSDAHKDILGFVSNQVAMAIERKRAEEALQQKLDALSVLHTVATVGAEATSEDDLIERATTIIGEVLFPDNFGFMLLDRLKGELYTHPSYRGVSDDIIQNLRIPLGVGITGCVAATGMPIRTGDVSKQPEYLEIHHEMRSELCVPLKVGQRVLGVLNTESVKADKFSEADERLLDTLAGQLATAIERKRSEDALRTSEAQYRSLVETSLDAITLTDLNGIIMFANQQAASLQGFDSVHELTGHNVYEFIAPESLQAAQDNARLTYEQGSKKDMEYTVLRRDGSRFPVELSASLVMDSNGNPVGFLGVSRDITERKRREQEREAIMAVAAALRAAPNRAEMIPVILNSISDLLNLDGAALILGSVSSGALHIELACGCWSQLTGEHISLADTACMQVLESGEASFCNQLASESSDSNMYPFKGVQSVAYVPLIAQNQAAGVLCVGRGDEIQADDMRILTAVADMAANAIHRATLHEQTQRRVQRLAALRSVDMAISSSLDLRVSLNVLLDQLTIQLNVDAADVLVFSPFTRTLEFAAGRGFRSNNINHTRVRIGEGITGRAVLDRQVVILDNLAETNPSFLRDRMLATETFYVYYAVPLIAKGQLKGLLEVFHRSPLSNDSEWLDFFETLAGQAAIAIDNATLFNDLQRSNMELALAYDTTLEGWVHALDMRDRETEGHTKRVTEMTLRLAVAMGRSESEMVHIRRGALLHDIGKIAIPDQILQKPGPLNAREWEIMRQHPVYAHELLAPISFLHPALEIPYCHHERWDGSGYPRGLKGEQIPRVARIFALVDVWDALRSDRPYRKGWADEQVYYHLHKQSGSHFDPEITALFLPMIE